MQSKVSLTGKQHHLTVFAVPGSIISPLSSGVNKLIQQGAKLVTNISDILDELNLKTIAAQREVKQFVPENTTEAAILNCLSAQPVHIDEICRLSGLGASSVNACLAVMELKGMVNHFGAMNYSLSKEVQII